MKKNVVIGMLFCILTFILLPSLSFGEGGETMIFKCEKDEIPQLVITRAAKVEVEPDKAEVNIRILTEETRIDKAADKNNEKMNTILNILKEAGVEKKDIKTVEYNITPLYEGKPLFSKISRPTSYNVVNAIRVSFYKLDAISKVLSKVSEIETVNVGSLTFSSTKVEQFRKEALKKAAQSARETALDLVEAAGGKLGKVLRIQDNGSSLVAPPPRFVEAERMLARAPVAERAVREPEIESGTLQVEASCTITYEIQQM